MFQGSYVALVTPFHPDGSVNYEKLKQLCDWHVENGTDGLVVLGTTGESSTTGRGGGRGDRTLLRGRDRGAHTGNRRGRVKLDADLAD